MIIVKNNELAARAFETGWLCRVLALAGVLVLGAVSWLCAWWKQGGSAECRRRALVRAVALVLGALSWLCAWWRHGAGAGCWQCAW